jgi:lipopolysaccharide export LptBFGC system permease protein LptF
VSVLRLRRHDRYVLSAFWTQFGAVVLFFTVISVVLDLSERLARLLRFWEPLRAQGYQPAWLLVEFYLTLIPFIWLQVVPICVPIAAALALARLARRNELAPLVTSGVPARRVVVPIVVSGVAVAGFLVGLREVAAPTLGREQLRVSRLLTKDKPDRISKVPHFRDAFGALLSMDAYMPIARRMENALLTLRDPTGLPVEIRSYPWLDWDVAGKRWVATEGGALFPLEQGRTGTRREVPAGDPVPFHLDVGILDLTVTERGALGLSMRESAALVRAEPDNLRLVALHAAQWTGPLSAVVLLLLALPFAFRLDTKSPLPGLVSAIGVGALYYAAAVLVKGIGAGGDWNPVVVAWIPTVLFASLGVSLVAGMDR